MSRPKENDVLVIQDEKRDKKHLVRLRGTADGDDSELYGVIEKDRHIKSTRITFKPEQVILNLGSSPQAGMVYGLDAGRIYLGRKAHDSFGELHFFMKPSKSQWAEFDKAMGYVTRKLEKNNLTCLLNNGTLHEFHHKKGKYAGVFHRSDDPNQLPHRIEYYLDWATEVTASSFAYVILHELGHYLHMVGLKEYPKLNRSWIRLYNQTIRPRQLELSVVRKYRKELAKQSEPPSLWAKSQEDDEAKADLKVIFRWIQQMRRLSLKELDLLWGEEGDGRDEVLALLPDSELHSKDIQPSVSEYATKNFKELFAEAFSYYLLKNELKQNLPKEVTTLLEKSIPVARNALEKGSE